MPETLSYTDVLQILECGECHISFAIPRDLYRQCTQDNSHPFWCPAGHKLYFIESENAKLKARLKREEQWRREADTRARAARDQADAAERSARAYKGQVTRIRNRVANGVCPCCNRSFANLARHMTTQHPSYRDGGDG